MPLSQLSLSVLIKVQVNEHIIDKFVHAWIDYEQPSNKQINVYSLL